MLPMGNDTLQGGPAGVNLDAKKYEELISMGIAERLDKVPYLENQDKFFTSSIDREVASDSFSPIYQIAVFWVAPHGSVNHVSAVRRHSFRYIQAKY